MIPATGEQYLLSRTASDGRRWSAIVTEVAAGLRHLAVDGLELVETFPESSQPPSGMGITLAPWPNRVEDSRWTHEGETLQLDITEPKTGSALHGLLRFQPYRVVDQDESSISLVARIHPQHGWPFTLDIEARYALGDEGLTVTYTARNLSGERAPVAFGTHPFFRLGATPKAELVVTVPADIRYAVDERLIPTGTVAVDGDYDLRTGKALGELSLDDAFGGLAAQDGRTVSTVAGPDGVLDLWQEQVYGWIQVYTTETFPTADGPELAIAIEPMTAPPNALNTGEGLQWLEPGERFSASWGVGYTAR